MRYHRPRRAYRVGRYVPGHGYPVVSQITGDVIAHRQSLEVARTVASQRTVAAVRALLAG